MEYPQSIQPASENNTAVNSAAEKAYSEFVQQIVQPQSRGFISESDGRKIFSFETYLRETGISTELIYAYCSHIKATNFVPPASRKVTYSFIVSNKRTLAKVFLYAMTPGLCIYLLVAAFLWTFEISFWGLIPFLSFTLAGPVLLVAAMCYKFLKGQRQYNARAKQAVPSFFIKYFDNDELTYLKAKSRLFVEK